MTRRPNPYPKPRAIRASDTEEVRQELSEAQSRWAREEMAIDLAEQHVLDYGKVKQVLDRMESCDWFGGSSGDNPPYAAFLEAIRSIGANAALELFFQEDLERLGRRSCAFAELANPGIPLYSLAELSTLLGRFAKFIRAEKNHLLENGHPAHYFLPSFWLDALLARLYYDRVPEWICVRGGIYIQEWPCVWESHGISHAWDRRLGLAIEGLVPLVYIWRVPENSRVYPRPGWHKNPMVPPTLLYGETPRLTGLGEADSEHLEHLRRPMLEAKLAVLEEIQERLLARRHLGLMTAALKTLQKCGLTYEDCRFLLERDGFYLGLDIRTGQQTGAGPRGLPGGLTDLFLVVAHCEQELQEPVFENWRMILADLVPEGPRLDWRFRPRSYVELFSHPKREEYDRALDEYVRWVESIPERAGPFCVRLNQGLQDELDRTIKIRFPGRARNGFEAYLSRAIEDGLARFRSTGEFPKQPLLDDEETDEPKNVFRKNAGVWSVEYRGEKIHLKDTCGARYLDILLHRPRQRFDSFELRNLASAVGDPGEWDLSAIYERLTTEQRAEVGLHSEGLGGHGLGPEEENERRGGRSYTRDTKRAVDSVRKAVRLVARYLQKDHPELAAHLLRSVRFGRSCGYFPPEPTQWD